MKIIDVNQNTPEWLETRRGKISGTVLGDVYSKRGTRKIGFYQIIAERLGLDPDDENRMDRGLRLEEEALDIFSKEMKLGKTTTIERPGICISSFSNDVMNSPDALLKSELGYTGAVEVKCLSPARHLQAVIENKVPPEFESQVIQYFVVNDELLVLYVVFYDPRIPSVPFHVIKVNRVDVEDKIEFFKEWQLNTLKEIDEIIESLTF